MLEMTQLANEKLKQYLNQNNLTSAVRVAAMNSCSGQSLVLSLDEKKDGDTAIVKGEVELIIDQGLLSQLGSVTVDFVEQKSSGCGCGEGGGFSVNSANPLPKAQGSCGGSCSSCG
ncbi:MAG: IscA/HesB family protein [Proteobacteria bacterium]|nr:IscA/HesB family protein [Pseudomonadota bacterium]MBU4296576.1 IscA/HesB family protein [Pseudomonadota bacterium]MCG2748829.1 IscA/HesB family protein [Desulfobulbaceae bacterium]